MPESPILTAARNAYRRIAGPKATLSSIPLAMLRRVYGNEMTIRLDGEPFTVNLHDTVVSFQILAFRRYEPVETALMRRLVKPGACAVDVGANIGFFSVELGRLVKPSGRVLAIEPDPLNASFLRKNVAGRGLDEIVDIVQSALGESAGTALLYHDPWGNNGDHRLYRDNGPSGEGGSQDTVSVPVSRLDDVVGQWPRVDFIKMDIQGFEPFAFRGMRETIARSPDLLLLTEFWPHGLRGVGFDPLEYLDALRSAGLQIWDVGAETGALEKRDPALDRAFVAELESNRPNVSFPYANLLCARRDELVDRTS